MLVSLTLALLLLPSALFPQTPSSFNYQAVARSNGEILKNTTLEVRLSLLQGSESGAAAWSETQTVTTNDLGLFTLQAGRVTPVEVDWSAGPYYLKVEVDLQDGNGFQEMGTAQVLPVPYALYARDVANKDDADADPQNEIQDLQLNGNILTITKNGAATEIDLSPYLDNPGWNRTGDTLTYPGSVGVGTETVNGSKLAVQGDDVSSSEALFEVKRKDGQPVFSVYNDSVVVHVNDAATKGPRGGFLISGFGPLKGGGQNYLRVTPDSVRIYINATDTKGPRGGFAIGGFGPLKGSMQEYLRVTEDSTRIYIKDQSKGPRGGFAIDGFGPLKGIDKEYFKVSTENNLDVITPSRPRILWYPKKEAFLTGRVLVESPDSVGTNSMATGFESKAIGDFSQAMGYQAISRGKYSTAIGYMTIANADNSYSIGENNITKNLYSFAFGKNCTAEGSSSFAFGISASSKGQGAFAFGTGAQAVGAKSYAFGEASYTNGYGSYAFGSNAKSKGTETFAIGTFTEANANYSIAFGYNVKTGTTNWNYATVLGKYNSTNVTSPLLVIGNGTGNNNRSNALVLKTNGFLGLGINAPSQRLDINGYLRAYGVYSRYQNLPILIDPGNQNIQLNAAYGFLQLGYKNTSFITFSTLNAGSGNGTERMRITNNGNVGIGYTSPHYKLDVNGEIASRSSNALRLRKTNYSAILRNDDSNFYLLLTNSGSPDGSWNSLRPFVVKLSNGFVGIGTTPSYPFHVTASRSNNYVAWFTNTDTNKPHGIAVEVNNHNNTVYFVGCKIPSNNGTTTLGGLCANSQGEIYVAGTSDRRVKNSITDTCLFQLKSVPVY